MASITENRVVVEIIHSPVQTSTRQSSSSVIGPLKGTTFPALIAVRSPDGRDHSKQHILAPRIIAGEL